MVIVKVQRELTTGHKDKTVHISSQDRTIWAIQPMSKDVKGWFGKGSYKFYAEADLIKDEKVDGGVIVNLRRKARDQDPGW